MPSNLLNADSEFPTFAGDETAEEKIKALQDYIFLLAEDLRYTLQNLNVTNFNASGLSKLSGAMADGSISADKVDLNGAVTLNDLDRDARGAIATAAAAAQAAALAVASLTAELRNLANGEYPDGAFVQKRKLSAPELEDPTVTGEGLTAGAVKLTDGADGAGARISCAAGRLRIETDGAVWLLDSTGWTKEETAG